MSRFRVLDEAIAFAVSCEEIASVLRRRGCGRALASQLSRAADSVALNVSEGLAFRGKRRMNHYRIALGTGREAVTGIHLAIAKRRMGKTDAAVAVALRQGRFICGALGKITRSPFTSRSGSPAPSSGFSCRRCAPAPPASAVWRTSRSEGAGASARAAEDPW